MQRRAELGLWIYLTWTHPHDLTQRGANFFGAIDVNIDAELAQLGPTGNRPLRVCDGLF
ncbi:hypothetical protein NG2371_05577 [Nocardia gamkensis]|nr:hypothetical protein [Nocardia gamkensis]